MSEHSDDLEHGLGDVEIIDEHGLGDIVIIVGCKCGRAIIDNASEASAMARLEDHCEHPERTPAARPVQR